MPSAQKPGSKLIDALIVERIDCDLGRPGQTMQPTAWRHADRMRFGLTDAGEGCIGVE